MTRSIASRSASAREHGCSISRLRIRQPYEPIGIGRLECSGVPAPPGEIDIPARQSTGWRLSRPSTVFAKWRSSRPPRSRGNSAVGSCTRVCCSASRGASVHAALDGHVLTREELALAVEQITGVQWLAEAVRSSWGWILKPASFRGRLCFAPSQGGRARFTTPTTWIGSEIDRPDSMDAFRQIARGYLAAYAPLSSARKAGFRRCSSWTAGWRACGSM